MFRAFSVTVVLLLSITPFSRSQINKQYKKDSIKITECPVSFIKINDTVFNNKGQGSIPFSFFLFEDVRFETQYIGVINRKKYLSTNGFLKLTFDGSTEKVLADFFNDTTKYAFKASGEKLLCFIKKLRFTQIDSISKESKKELYTTVTIEFEAYLASNDHYYPALRLDTVASSFTAKEEDVSVLTDVLNAFAKKAALVDLSKILGRKAYSYNEIRDRYHQRFNWRILRDTVLRKGVYKTKEEFLNNTPSIKDYEFNKEGILYTKTENSEFIPTREAFGICDGTRIWMNVHKVFRPLIRQGQTFEFLADMKLLNEVTQSRRDKTVHVHRSPGMSIGEYSALYGTTNLLLVLLDPKNYLTKFIYQLNLETGEFY